MTTFYLLTSIIIAFLTILSIIQVAKNKGRKKHIDEAKKNLAQAIHNKDDAHRILLGHIKASYGEEVVDRILKKRIWINMPNYLLLVSWGKASDIKSSVFKEIESERWYYGEYLNRLGNIKYSKEVILENDRVVGWKDLN